MSLLLVFINCFYFRNNQPNKILHFIDAIKFHSKSIEEYKAEQVYAYATSVIRSTNNGLEFVDSIYKKFDYDQWRY